MFANLNPTYSMTTERSAIRRVLGIWLLALVAPVASASEASSWLMKINEAAEGVSFAGEFVYLHDGEIEAMQVARRIDDGEMKERLYALNGDAREVIRDSDRVWCFIPDKNVAVHDYRQLSESGFPRMLPADVDGLKSHYQFEMGGTERIAGRTAREVRVVPLDEFRYGYRLWADTESGLLLRSDLVDDAGGIVEQYLFVDIQIGGDIPDSALKSITDAGEMVWYGMDRPDLSAEVSDGLWRIDNPPAGYRLTRHFRRMTPMEMKEEEHFVFTDGLSSVSVFVKEAEEGKSTMTGLSRMGAVHAWRDARDDHWVTVMGEVPAATVQYLAEQISYQPQ